MSYSNMRRPLRGMAAKIRFAPGTPDPGPVAECDYIDDDDDDEFEADDLDDEDDLGGDFLSVLRAYAPARPPSPPPPKRKGFASKIRFAGEQRPEEQPPTPAAPDEAALAKHNDLEQRISALENKVNRPRGGFASKIRFPGQRPA